MLNTGQQRYVTLPIFGEKIPPEGNNKDTIYYQIPDFKVVNQYGDTVTQANLNDGIYVANFFFASCEDVCPSMNRRAKLIYDDMQELAYKNRKLAEEKGLTTIDFQTFLDNGFVSKKGVIKVLGRGELTSAIQVKAHAFSESAIKAIEAAGGKAETI
jgi:hypothetical protein